MAARREDLEREAKALDDRRLTEKARTARNMCTDWTATHREASDTWIYTSDDEQAEIDAAKAAMDQWCLMAQVYEAELRQRRAERPAEVGATVNEVDQRRAGEREERRERYDESLEQDLEKQRERSVLGIPGQAAKTVSSWFDPARFVGLAEGQTAEERSLGLARLVLIAGSLAAAYYLLLRPAGGFFATQAESSSRMMAELAEKSLPGGLG